MRVTVVGAGIAGVATAHELAQAGHEVQVLERRASVAAEGSFAHAGLLAPALAAPWADAGMAGLLVPAWLRPPALRLAGIAGLRQLGWVWRGWRSGRGAPGAVRRQALQQLALLGRQRADALTRRLALDYEQSTGVLLLQRTEGEARAARARAAVLQAAGMAAHWVDAQRARALEPALHGATALAGALHLPQDGAGNCRQFAHQLKAEAQRLGARFVFGRELRRLVPGAPVTLELGGGQTLACDAVVLCTGLHSLRRLAPAAPRLPLAAVHGCSVTAPLRHLDSGGGAGPRAAVVDQHHHVTITRLGDRVRVAGALHIGVTATAPPPPALQLLYRVLQEWFPGAAVVHQAQHWLGAMPTLPDGLPVLGAAGPPGLWLNLGHGAHGWTGALAAAHVLAAQMAGHEATLDTRPFAAERWR